MGLVLRYCSYVVDVAVDASKIRRLTARWGTSSELGGGVGA
ncbi:MAG: hypothetical protein ACPL3C_09975 [Pyrobaculum sp.]|nr:hypothetical protein [Pyrobaculum sp. 3827-6]MCU7788265.1 hypothetical protein [Pyrobaculum sp. 3827-6]